LDNQSVRQHLAVRLPAILAVLLLAFPALAQKPAPRKAPAGQPPAAADSQADDNQPKRLIMTDGSYQQTVRWEIKGDRVRYLSAERYEWEEVPKSMVDWAATEKYEKERQASAAPEVQQVDAEQEAERQAEEAKSPTVAPGLHLPSQGGVFLLDTFQGQPQLLEVRQNSGQLNANRAGNILRATVNPLAKTKQTIELNGLHARVQAHVSQPTLYLNVEADENDVAAQAENPDTDRFRIVRLRPKKDTRIVGVVEISIIGKSKQTAQFTATKTEPVSSAWVKVTPQEPLQPGEYAVVEMLGKDVNLYVWDFGVNPSAPANPDAWKPEPVVDAQPGAKSSPQLQPGHPKP